MRLRRRETNEIELRFTLVGEKKVVRGHMQPNLERVQTPVFENFFCNCSMPNLFLNNFKTIKKKMALKL